MPIHSHNGRSRHLRRIDIADREEKQIARERRQILAPRYIDELGSAPILEPGDIEGAKRRLAQITRLIEKGGWTKDERNRLKRMRRKWQKKAAGQDEWFNIHGNPHAGDDAKYGHEGWEQQQFEWQKTRKPTII